MTEELLDLTYKLKEALNNSKEVKELNEAEKLMENDETVMGLSYRYQCAQTEYNDILKIYKENSDEAKKAQHNLYLKKKELEEHPYVREYLQKYQTVRLIYEKIDDALFSKFRENTCEHHK